MGDKIKIWTLAIAIAIVFNLFVNYGIATFYPGPEYQDFCDQEFYPRIATPEKDTCVAVNVSTEDQETCADQNGYIAYRYDSQGCATESYCETCQYEHEQARKSHAGIVFVVLLIASVIALGIGITNKKEAISTGFSLAGILGLIIASVRYWEHLADVYRFMLLGVVFAILIYLGYKKVK